MPATFEKGDIFHTDGLRAYAQGCDCEGGMDKGIAVAFRKKFPLMFEEYRARCQDGRFRVGDVFAFREGDETVFCLGIHERSDTKVKVPALTKTLLAMAELAQKDGIERVALSRIGAAPGGLDWPRAKKVISEVEQQTSVTFVVFEQFIRSASA